MDKIEQFKKEYCSICGTQRCTSEGEWLEACPEYKKFMNETPPPTKSLNTGVDLVQVVKDHVKTGMPSESIQGKKHILEMCDKLGIKTIDEFWDVLIQSQRMYCCYNFWNHQHSPCMDSEGNHIAYGKDIISAALEKPKKDLTCHDISEVCGSCAYINQIDMRLFYYLAELMDDKGLKTDE